MVKAFRKKGGPSANEENYGVETHSFRPTGRPEMRWEGDVKRELKTLKTFHWKKQAKCRNGWKRIIEGDQNSQRAGAPKKNK